MIRTALQYLNSSGFTVSGILTPSRPVTSGAPLGGVNDAPTDRRLPVPAGPLRDHRGPQTVYTCHCLDCQRLTGSSFSLGIVVPEKRFHLTGVEPRRLQRTADSGRVNTRLVCPECGSWICRMPRDGVARVRGGALDDTSWLRPRSTTL
jgi:hypothetical protein